MDSRLARTIAELQKLIASGNIYEAKTTIRTKARRYENKAPPLPEFPPENPRADRNAQREYDEKVQTVEKERDAVRPRRQAAMAPAISILHSCALTLLRIGQGAEGADLALYMLQLYNKGEFSCTEDVDGSKERKIKALDLLRAFPPTEPKIKQFVSELIGWSQRFGEYPAGDPELHHVAGVIFAANGDALDAERHLLLGGKDSPAVLAALEYEWYSEDSDPSTAPLYAARAILPYLLLGNLRAANQCYLLFTTSLSQSATGKSLGVQNITSKTRDLRIYPSLPLLNFLGLLLLAVQLEPNQQSQQDYNSVKRNYSAQLNDVNGAWDEALANIAEQYFGIRPARQSNPLGDIMNMFMGGGGSGGGRSRGAPPELGLD